MSCLPARPKGPEKTRRTENDKNQGLSANGYSRCEPPNNAMGKMTSRLLILHPGGIWGTTAKTIMAACTISTCSRGGRGRGHTIITENTTSWGQNRFQIKGSCRKKLDFSTVLTVDDHLIMSACVVWKPSPASHSMYSRHLVPDQVTDQGCTDRQRHAGEEDTEES